MSKFSLPSFSLDAYLSVPVVPVLPVRFKTWKEREEEEEIERGRGRGSVQSGAAPTPDSEILRRNFVRNFTAKSAKSSEEDNVEEAIR